MNKKHAVVDATNLVVLTPDMEIRRIPLRRVPYNITQLLGIGQALKITNFWIMPGIPFDNAGYDALKTSSDDYDIAFQKHDPLPSSQWPLPTSCNCHMKSNRFEIVVTYPSRGRFEWDIHEPQDILLAVDAIEHELGVTCQYSPGHIGMALLKKIHSSPIHREWMRKPWINMEALPFMNSAPVVRYPIHGCNPMNRSMVGKYLHFYDKNSAYLGAARGVLNGCGDPIHVDNPAKINPDLPGLYRVEVLSTTWPRDLPHVITTDWVQKDVLHFAIANGYEVLIKEAYQFEEGHKMFETWAKHLWEARVNLRGGGTTAEKNAYKTIKTIACAGIGRVGMNPKTYGGNPFYRPQWWCDVVGNSRSHMLYHLKKYYDAGHVPVFVDTDEVCYVEDDPDPNTAVPGILDRVDMLGGFKVRSSLLLTEEIVEASMNQRAPLSLLKKYARVK